MGMKNLDINEISNPHLLFMVLKSFGKCDITDVSLSILSLRKRKASLLKELRGFIIIWAGQVFSMIGSQMTHFAMGIWAWEKTGQATPLALVGFFSFAPLIIFTPIAGVLVDRWNRKLVMALSDIGAGLVTVTILILLLTNQLEIWHLYITGVVGGLFGAFQWPAYSAAITLLVPKQHYTRTSGMISMAESGVGIFAPILAGILLPIINITGIRFTPTGEEIFN